MRVRAGAGYLTLAAVAVLGAGLATAPIGGQVAVAAAAAAEMIPQGFRDTLSNWGTFIWSAPPP